ncbi:MAG: sugar ABC transporter ATP-binding protein [Spirochaetes bacterium]|nr:MAG: sugar ABC transporter ATP-binding protein [Spirochaetota bacterium]
MEEILVEVKNISKNYAGVKALDKVDMVIRKGEVRCLVGENGSGKSTLIKVIAGVENPDEGEIIIRGIPHKHIRAIEAIREGIQVIYQDLSLFPNLTVAENISLNYMVEKDRKIINWNEVKNIAQNALREIGEEIDLTDTVGNLSMAKRQTVAICRALIQDARLIIMDEPTTALTRDDVDHLFSVIKKLKSKGISILFVTHKLSEIFQISDVVTILRDGKKVGDYKTEDLDNEKLTLLMTGKKIEYINYVYEESIKYKTLLRVENLTRKGHFKNITLDLKEGEILGITGLVGSGRTELALSIFGLNPADSGKIYVNEKLVNIKSPKDAKSLGISYLPEDRLTQGLFLSQSIENNITVTVLNKVLNKFFLIDKAKKKDMSQFWIKNVDIKTPSMELLARNLSGGNQQKVVLAKWLATDPKIFILDGPTIGIDVASKSNIYKIIKKLASEGMGIIIISDEIPEVLRNCNRIIVMRNGRIIKKIDKVNQITEDELLNIVIGKEFEGVSL